MKRTCWLWCPHCRRDLNGDNESFLGEIDNHWHYRCANCGHDSRFSLHYPLPVCVL